jgi:hypothetical protein
VDRGGRELPAQSRKTLADTPILAEENHVGLAPIAALARDVKTSSRLALGVFFFVDGGRDAVGGLGSL